MLTPTYYLVLGALVFVIGAVGLLVRRNPLVMFMCVELMINAVNLTFVGLAFGLDDIGGQVAVFFVMVVAAAEVVVGLAIVVAIMRRRDGATAEDDGYLITFTTDMVNDLSECVVLDAARPNDGPVARIRLPERISSGTHSTWAPLEDLAPLPSL